MAWYDEAIIYHLYPLGLLDAPKQNAYEKPKNRLKELKPWLEHIKALGADTVLIGPVFESATHGYDTTDLRTIDSRLGKNKDFKRFVEDAHKLGIRVVVDAVFNHVGRDFWAFKDVQKNRENSAYVSWFSGIDFNGDNYYHDGFSYETWRGYDTLIKLNLQNPSVRNYLLESTTDWMSEYDIDGLRLDSADVLDFNFMHELREVTESVKPDFWLMGEVIHGEYNRWVEPGLLHAVTNYSMHQGLFNAHNTHNYFEIAHTVQRNLNLGGGETLGLRLYNFVDNQDVSRIASKVENKADLFPIYTLVYTLPGVPSIYYGSEFGLEGARSDTSDEIVRPALNLADFKDDRKTNPLTVFLEKLAEIRKDQKALSYGEYRELVLTNRQYAFARITDTDAVIVAVNNDDEPAKMSVDGLGRPGYIDALTGEKFEITDWQLNFEVSAHGSRVFVQTARPAGL